ncbi:carotenoid oxygenase family protein [Humitalea sp. 24SJ18S-53]|uniref:carotenoid oxygenase family protein n=1 Tax=Humitalea sp. 24SJ18S-53 TaxID=3422307 RepID=UPI003D66DFBC
MPYDADPSDNYAPIHSEQDLPNLPVIGELPKALAGTLFRNGPNPQFAPIDPAQHHWFSGDGMIHGFTLENGRAAYRNRWVRTDKWQAEHAAGKSLLIGFGRPSPEHVDIPRTGVANTNIVWHAGRLMALEEAHQPFGMNPRTLATEGVVHFDRPMEGPFTAHPKIDPVTGELIFFGYSASGPLSAGMTYGTLDRAGRVTRHEAFDAPYCSMVHDFAVTDRHVLFPVLPLVGRMERAMAGQMPYMWEPDLGGHIGVIRRDQGVASLRWFRAEACYVYHILNAWEDGERILVDVMQYDAPPLFGRIDGRESTHEETSARLVRWTLEPGTDAFRRTVLDDMAGEFPRLDDRRAGLANRFGTFAGSTRPDRELNTAVWHDFSKGQRDIFTLPDGDALSEAVFVPRGPDAPEGDGWLLTVAWRGNEQRSDLLVLDTQGVDKGPVAAVQLPDRVPFGFHGNWVGA